MPPRCGLPAGERDRPPRPRRTAPRGAGGRGGPAAPVRPRARRFRSRASLRAWFERNHASAKEIWIAYYRSGVPGTAVTYAEAVEEALCFGWVDGQLRSLDSRRYAHRYTPRRPNSRWSATNVRRIAELRRVGRLRPAGLAAFARRSTADRPGYSLQERPTVLAPELLREFRAHPTAWRFFEDQAPSYRRTAIFWVMSARRPETRVRRLRVLVADSGELRRLDLLSPGRRTVDGARPSSRPPVRRPIPR